MVQHREREKKKNVTHDDDDDDDDTMMRWVTKVVKGSSWTPIGILFISYFVCLNESKWGDGVGVSRGDHWLSWLDG